ncbi:hypothetical protein KEM60_03240 [Austwickia sp. TVS 96-490-7B]|uniref:hypothetical protein n=1 Tax=Austwickia sp. TVS 96-490-7B TaxID=2830843 RepID=UPI001C55EA7F|nr:hypothetical protein [Austwickia sp. TVS 96-490-7B]MBW3087010.1 hypothetical protein [Austwickia sp. TVS 96-490-7B]
MDIPASQAREDAAAILASAPSVLAKAAAFVRGDGPAAQIDWAKIAYFAGQNVLSSGDRAFLGICAEIAGHNPDGRHPDQTFGARWDCLDGQHQSVIASVLAQSSQSKQCREREILEQLGVPSAYPSVPRPQLVRVRLGPDQPAVTNDALGRERVGYRDGASPHETWLRGRGVWRMQADRVIASQWLIVAHAGVVRMVGTIDGLTIHGDRIAIIGQPLPDHPYIGKPDPLDNNSQNPVAYGDMSDMTDVA